ncbi:MAG TPA: hypothetical protein VGM07_06640 [Stellaceae bacterium]|jgi:hypothetical protein
MGELSKPEDHIVAVRALCDKRAEVALQLSEMERRQDQLRAELVHIDAVLRLFRPDLDPADIPARKRRHARSDYFAHGEITRRAYDAMRSGVIVAAADIASLAMADKGLDGANDAKTRADFVRRITMQLNAMARDGRVAKVGSGRGVKWKLAVREQALNT